MIGQFVGVNLLSKQMAIYDQFVSLQQTQEYICFVGEINPKKTMKVRPFYGCFNKWNASGSW